MDPNLEKASNEIVQASAPVQQPAPEKPKKSTGLITTAILTTILALVGIGFGVYGMFFYNKPDCSADCPKSDISDTTNDSQSTAPSVAEVKQLLESKYGYKEVRVAWKTMEGNRIMSGFWDNLDSIDDAVKLAFTIKASEDLLTEGDWSSIDVTRSVDYDTLNARYHFYFGNENNIPKEEVTISYSGIVSSNYLPDTNTLEIHFANGLGGYSTLYELSKIDEVVGTKDDFTAKILAIDVDSVVKQSADYEPNKMGDGTTEEYYITMTDEVLKETQETLSAYKLNFINENGEYKLMSVEKD